jgi:DNA-binding CsgD family transcriptional regulator
MVPDHQRGAPPHPRRWRMSPGRDRRIDSASATMTRMVRRRNAGYQRVDAAELRDALRLLTERFIQAAEGDPVDPLHEVLSAAVKRRLQQGLHPLEVFGAWTEVRKVLEAAVGDEPNTVQLLDECERVLVRRLREGVALRPPLEWPADELLTLRRAVERLMIGLELIEQSAPRPMVSAAGQVAALTRRERDILTLAAAGSTTGQTAAEMGVSKSTVRTYIARSIKKLGAANRTHAIAIAVSSGAVIPSAAAGQTDLYSREAVA